MGSASPPLPKSSKTIVLQVVSDAGEGAAPTSESLGYDRTSLMILSLGFFMGAVEYGIIMPSLWNYLLSLGLPTKDEFFMGIVLGSFNLTQMLTAPFYGSVFSLYPLFSPLLSPIVSLLPSHTPSHSSSLTSTILILSH
jgi:hypothetical protein